MTGVDIAWGALLWVALGGGVGAALRYAVDVIVTPRWPRTFPLATFVVNVTGSLLLGVLAGLVVRGAPAGALTVLGVGFCGGYTTFSTACVESVNLLRQGRAGAATLNAAGSLALTAAAAWARLLLTRGL